MAGEVTIEEDCHPTQLWDACDPYGEGPAILKIIETPDPALSYRPFTSQDGLRVMTFRKLFLCLFFFHENIPERLPANTKIPWCSISSRPIIYSFLNQENQSLLTQKEGYFRRFNALSIQPSALFTLMSAVPPLIRTSPPALAFSGSGSRPASPSSLRRAKNAKNAM